MALRGAFFPIRLVVLGSGLGRFRDQIEGRTVRNCEPALLPDAVRNDEFQQLPTRVRRMLFEKIGRLAGQLQELDAGVQVRLVGALVVGQGGLDAVLVGAEFGQGRS
ncbi:MAG TPA: hypothetical protein VNZ26_17635 [Vicinamibacterales bacterium]|nr:hypothetical protein [Vicinamibacterales bacterium]